MQGLLRHGRFLLPALFLGYAAVVNVSVLTREGEALAGAGGRVINGEFTARFDDLYAGAMPHRELARGWLGAARYMMLGEGRDGVVVGEGGWLFTKEELRVADAARIEDVAGAVARIEAELAARGTELLLLPVPAKLDVMREHGPGAHFAMQMQSQHESFVTTLRRRGLTVADPRAALAAMAGQGPDPFLRTDTHWTPEGAMAAARAVAETGLAGPVEAEFAATARPATEVQGDLVRFVTIDGLAPALGLGPERLHPFTAVSEAAAAAAGGIFAAEAPAVGTVLVGTSYSADETWSLLPALQVALGRDILNHARSGLGPMQPMLDYLSGSDFEAAPPKLVIWEFPTRYLAEPGLLDAAPGSDPEPATALSAAATSTPSMTGSTDG
ncbi:MAG: alginate O-acetyltransferase AlgX-related protein [Limimaricola soesokkakensis]|uniref:alginate O-acetyltransferase AlgX-related protein n=1 Tax=Limimaricola soesokkakensis TaxID=1343159 RepID=UPI004059B50D